MVCDSPEASPESFNQKLLDSQLLSEDVERDEHDPDHDPDNSVTIYVEEQAQVYRMQPHEQSDIFNVTMPRLDYHTFSWERDIPDQLRQSFQLEECSEVRT